MGLSMDVPAEELTALLADLVRIASPSGDEGSVQAFIAGWFDRHGIPARVEPAIGGLSNVVVEIVGDGEGPTLFIGGHCDTVTPAAGWTRQPHQPTVEDGRLYGLGAMDMKAGIASAMHVVRDFARRPGEWSGRIVFAALADEEAHSRGARGFLDRTGRIDAAIMCEPHFDIPSISGMGKINLKVVVTGRSAHGSRPRDGINAATEAARLLVALDGVAHASDPRYGEGSHCVLSVGAGLGPYEIRVPDRCEFLVNWHLLPGEDAEAARRLVAELAASLGSPAGFDVAIAQPRYDAFVIAEDDAFVRAFAGSYERVLGRAPQFSFCFGVSDANIFNAAGIPTLLFGPGGANMHAADEWADLAQLSAATRVYLDFADRFLRGTRTERTSP